MNLLFLDFETYYSKEYSLRHMSPPEYILDPRFAVTLLAAFDSTWAAPRIIEAPDIPEFLKAYPPEQTACCAHNALFDLSILAWRYDYVPARCFDTIGMARALRTFPRYSLDAVLIGLFGASDKGTVIHKVIGKTAQDIKNAGLWPEYRSYAMRDVRNCANIFLRLIKEFPDEECKIMDLVLKAALQPRLHANVALLEEHLQAVRAHKAALLRDCGYEKAALMSTFEFQQALERLGVEVKMKISRQTERPTPAFAKSDNFMAELLNYDKSADDEVNYQVQCLASARLAHKSTIEETRAERFINIAKLPWGNGGAMLPVPLRYAGAHTHRLCLDGATSIVVHNNGLKEIRLDHLKNDDLIWDGEAFVRHGGLAYAGIKEVIEYDGIIGTPDHRVWTVEHGCRSLAEAKARGYDIARGDVPDSARIDPSVYWPDPIQDQDTVHLQSLWQGDAVYVERFAGSRRDSLQVMPQASRRLERSGLGIRATGCSVGTTTLRRSEERFLQGLWSARDSVPLRVGSDHGGVGLGEPWTKAKRQIDRSNRQRWPLRTGQPALGDTTGAKHQQATWDIVACGPRNRFMANGRIVHNSGEWSMNMQNLPRDKAKSKLRTAVQAPPGHKLVVADLSQIEARCVAVLCDEIKLVEAFRNGEDVYASFASYVFQRDINKVDQPLERFIGKTAILGLGYGCGAIRFRDMVLSSARQFGIPMDGKDFPITTAWKIVDAYRGLYSSIEAAWKKLDWAWKSVINNELRTQYTTFGPVKCEAGRIVLPNNMALRYTHGDKYIYGAKLLENITQALARNIVMQTAVRLADRGYQFALQAHDELGFVVEDDNVETAKSVIMEEMLRTPDWLPALPLAAEIGVGDNYGNAK